MHTIIIRIKKFNLFLIHAFKKIVFFCNTYFLYTCLYIYSIKKDFLEEIIRTGTLCPYETIFSTLLGGG